MRDSKRDTDVKNRLMDSVGEGEGGMIWENNIKTCILLCDIDDWSKFDAWNMALRTLTLGQPTGMGWDGEGEGGDFRTGGHMYTRGWFMSMYGKTTTIL